ncbi:hypothetical protein CL619_03740 [archaeon]|nr:hypothetical protein [archaeon]|tara:strand:+ start:1693 stop:2454 length:762 start_codon:yes stop_codon:yes gene_type:complete
MKPDHTQLLQKFDLSPTAAKVYLALLKLGSSSADKIAKEAGTYKANVYEALEKLGRLGLATSILEKNKRQFIPTNPEKLPQIIDEIKEQKLARLNELKEDIATIMPQLQAQYQEVKDDDLFEIYRGRRAYKAVIREILKTKPESWKGFGNFQIQIAFPNEYKLWFKDCSFRLFSTKTPNVIKHMKEAAKTCDVKVTWLPKEVYMPIVWVVFGNNVLIIIYEPDLILIRLQSKQVVDTFSSQFDYLWKKYNGKA